MPVGTIRPACVAHAPIIAMTAKTGSAPHPGHEQPNRYGNEHETHAPARRQCRPALHRSFRTCNRLQEGLAIITRHRRTQSIRRSVVGRDISCLPKDVSMHLIGDDRRTRRRFHVDTRNGQCGYRHDISMRLPLRRAWPTVPGLAKIGQRLERAHRHASRISRCTFPDRRFRRRDIDDFPMRPAEPPGRGIRIVQGDDDASGSRRNMCPRDARRDVVAAASKSVVHLSIRKLTIMVEIVDRYRKRISKSNCGHDCEKYRGADTRSQKSIKSHGAIPSQVRSDVSYDQIDTRDAVHATIVDADSRFALQT
ncbi:hypothetical protein BCO18430_00067 [Burkholderia contaminans]|nr:hypothetical protein BCO18430_00067 [Burkholderia contaminans]